MEINISHQQAENAADWIISNFYGKNVLQKRLGNPAPGHSTFYVYRFKASKQAIADAYCNDKLLHSKNTVVFDGDILSVPLEKDVAVTMVKFKNNSKYIDNVDRFNVFMSKGNGDAVKIDLASIYNPELPDDYLEKFNTPWYTTANKEHKLVNFRVLDSKNYMDIQESVVDFLRYDNLRAIAAGTLFSCFKSTGI